MLSWEELYIYKNKYQKKEPTYQQATKFDSEII